MSNDNIVLYERKPLPAKLPLIGWSLLLIGVVLTLLAFSTDNVRASYNLIILLMMVFSIGFGSLFLIALEHIVGSDWSVPFRRLSEIIAAVLFATPLIALPLFLNLDQVFSWLNPVIMESDKYVKNKSPYLNESFFVIRNIFVFLVMFLFYFLLVGRSLKQDKSGKADLKKWSTKISAIFMPIFAILITVVAMDWLMSLEPKWFSTIFGVYYFAGSVLAALAVLTFIAITLAENGYLSKFLTEDHYYNFGALMFAFTNFWAYIAFSQFMLIWYANIPDETMWYMQRGGEGWMTISLGLIFIRFLIPYMALVTRPSKSNPFRLKIIAVWVFVAHYYDLYWIIMPEYTKKTALHAPVYSWFEFTVPILVVGVIIVVFSLVAGKKNLMPIGDPKFRKGLEFHL
jgi:MFS family permease